MINYNHLQYYIFAIFKKQFLIKYTFDVLFTISDFFVFLKYKKKRLLFVYFFFFLFYGFSFFVKKTIKFCSLSDFFRFITIVVYLTPKHGYSKVFNSITLLYNKLLLVDFSHSTFNPFNFKIKGLKSQKIMLIKNKPFWWNW